MENLDSSIMNVSQQSFLQNNTNVTNQSMDTYKDVYPYNKKRPKKKDLFIEQKWDNQTIRDEETGRVYKVFMPSEVKDLERTRPVNNLK